MSSDQFSEIIKLLGELVKWTRFAGMQQLRNVLLQNLKTDTEKSIYELSDGTRGSREVVRFSGVKSKTTVLAYWKKWGRIGIVEPSPNFSGRYQRICSLEEVGIEVPELLVQSKPAEEITEEDEVNT